MSFLCGKCGRAERPGVKPTIKTTVKPTIHTFVKVDPDDEDRKGYLETKPGTQIVEEIKVCSVCSGVQVKAPVPVDLAIFRAMTAGAHNHVSGCNKLVDTCFSCKTAIRNLRGFTLPVLSECLADMRPMRMVNSLARLVVGDLGPKGKGFAGSGLVARTQHDTKRAKRDFQVGFAVMKRYEELGGQL